VLSIGRLDINTEGLLLLTNDGGLARMLELPETGWLRRYRVRAFGSITQDKLDTLRDGVTIEGMPMARSSPASSASRAPTPGSWSICARARTARSRRCSSISAST
jgi:pseudouridine synthase